MSMNLSAICCTEFARYHEAWHTSMKAESMIYQGLLSASMSHPPVHIEQHACGLQMSIRDEDTLPLSLPPQQRDSISRPSVISRSSFEPTRPTPSQQVHRDDSARVSKGVNSIIT